MLVKNCLPSRFDILSWINDTLLLPLTCIEELGAGNVYCQLLDAAYPETVPLHKVKWDAKSEVDFLHNFKILQASFDRLAIDKNIQVAKLIRIKYHDNLEFVQWMKSFLQHKIDYRSYQPLCRRGFMRIDLSFAKKKKFHLTLNKNANKENSELSQNLRDSNVSKKSMVSLKSTRNLKSSAILSSQNINLPKPKHRRQKSSGLVSILTYEKQIKQKETEKQQKIKLTSRHMRHSSMFFGQTGIIESDNEQEELF